MVAKVDAWPVKDEGKETKSGDDWLNTAGDELITVANGDELTIVEEDESPTDGEV